MGYVPVMPPGLRVRPVPPQNQRGDKVGASIPRMQRLARSGDLGLDECRDQWMEDHLSESAPFWTSGTITASILALCLFSYGIGLWHGQMQGLVIAKAGDQLEKPE